MKKQIKKPRSVSGRPPAANHIAQTILNSISAHVAILDQNGFIIETNRAWKQFAEENRIQMRPDTLGINYLAICDRAGGKAEGEPLFAAAGIRDVIAGRSKEFVMDYPCHSPERKRWFYMRVTRAAGPEPLRIVVSHEDITALKLAEERTCESEAALLLEKQKLEEANTALKVLLRQREADQFELETNMLDNMQRLVSPLLARLFNQTLSAQTRTLLTSLETRLKEITTPFLSRLSAVESTLTPQEIEVAALIRQGLGSKEIAVQLHLSLATVNFHRRNLRRKLNIRNTSTNLRTFLTRLTE